MKGTYGYRNSLKKDLKWEELTRTGSMSLDKLDQGFPESVHAGKNNQAAHGYEHGLKGELSNQSGSNRSRQEASDNQSRHIGKRNAFQKYKKSDGTGQDDEEFGKTHGTDHISRAPSFRNERTGDESSPAPSCKCVKETTTRRQPTGFFYFCL